MPPAAPEGPRRFGLRLQVGLTGLGTMVLLVGLANIIMINAQHNEAQVVPEAASTTRPVEVVVPTSDPLADAGVVPDRSAPSRSPAPAPESGDPDEAVPAPAPVPLLPLPPRP